MTKISIILAITAAIVGNINWYWMKSILKNNGYEVNYFYGHFDDFPNFFELISKQTNPKIKSKYRKIVWVIIGSITVLLTSIIIVITE